MRRLLLLPLALSCHKTPVSSDVPTRMDTVAREVPVSFTSNPDSDGLRMRLYDAEPPAEGLAALARPGATSLDHKAVALLMARLPPLESDPTDTTAFALRDGPQPPPRTGASVQASFPGQAGDAPTAAPGPLTVLRHAPDGEVPLAPHLSVTFSEPMVAVGSQDEAAKTVPVTLRPAAPGQWRWLGSKTLVFEPTTRFPMATAYTVEVAAGTTSATGSTLADTVAWTFGTPPPTLLASGPGGPGANVESQPRQPTIWFAFDQKVDPEAVLAHVTLKAGKGGAVALRLASSNEIAAIDGLRGGAWAPDRVVAVAPVSPLPLDSWADVTLGAGTPSAEGPRTTAAASSWRLRTYGPLKVTGQQCGWQGCRPGDTLSISLSNGLDAEAFDPSQVVVTPAVPGMSIGANGSSIWLSGETQGRTDYTVKLPASLKDVYGQALGKDHTATFKVGAAERQLRGPPGNLVVADPAGTPSISIWTVNEKALRVTIQRVAPADWDSYGGWLEDPRDSALPGKTASNATVAVASDPDRRVETAIDLSPYLKDGVGHFIVRVQQANPPKNEWERQSWTSWVQVSRIGLTAFVDGGQVLAWANELTTGKPLAGVKLRLSPKGTDSETSADGMGRLALPADRTTLLTATVGADTAFVPASEYPSRWSGWLRSQQTPGLRWYLASDRGLYRPGETVRVKGWMRVADGDRVKLPDPLVRRVKWSLRSSQGNPLAEGGADVSATGAVEIVLDLPKTPNLGQAALVVEPDGVWVGQAGVATIDIQEFRRPEFEVTAETDGGPWALGEDAIVTGRANYYAGGALPAAELSWLVTAAPASFVPPGRDDWSFGVWTPWWLGRHFGSEPYGGSVGEPQVWSSTTDAAGNHRLGIHFESLRPARPMLVTAEATVHDVNRQAMAASTTMLVHPSSLYVGLKASRLFVEKGQAIELSALVVDRNGVERPDVPATIDIVRSAWTHQRGRWAMNETAVAQCTTIGQRNDGPCRFEPTIGGEYIARATVTDAQGRPNLTEVRVWVTGAEATTPDRGVAMEEVTLVPDQAKVAPGGTLQLFILSPFSPAEGVLTVRSGDIVHSQRISLQSPSQTIALKVPESWIPDVAIAVDLVGAAARRDDAGQPRHDLAPRVAFAQGTLQLEVPALPRTLSVSVKPGAQKLDPGGNTTLEVAVADAAGAAVSGAELVLVAVDESVLALAGYQLPDPLSVFYTSRGDATSTSHLRAWVNLVNPTTASPAFGDNQGPYGGAGLGASGAGRGGGGEQADGMMAMSAPAEMAQTAKAMPPPSPPGEPVKRSRSAATEPDAAPSTTPIAVRSNFDALALWAPSVVTDSRGRATVRIDLPDSLTRYRVMVVAVSGADRFGSGQADLTARLPLMVRPSPPRFLNFGDRFSLPVVLQNQTDAPMTVDVAIRGANLQLDPGGSGGRQVVVPANDRVEVLFPAEAVEAGVARWQVAAQSGNRADAASGSLPVWTPASSEAFATYGTVTDQLVVQPITAPKDVWTQFGGLEVTTSSTQLQALTDAVLYLSEYPYGCSEQLGSRILGIAALRDVLTAFAADGLPAPAALEAAVSADLDALARRQNSDGGWGFWKRDERSFPYLSLHVAHALVRAQEKGFEVDSRTLDRALTYAAQIQRHLPRWYSAEAKRALRAYAVYIRELAGKDPAADAKALAGEELPLEAQGWILPTLHRIKSPAAATILKGWGNRVTESAGTAHFVTSYSDGAEVLLHSDRRVDAILLDALLRVGPQDELVPKLVAGLLAHKTAGRWTNTNESAFVLLALDRYFRVYEGVTPAFVARAWLGPQYAGDHSFQGRTTERAELQTPMAQLQGTQDLVLQRDGQGRMYYRIGLRYAPKELVLPAADRGFTVVRRYEAADDPADVRRDDDGVWRVRAGARVKVTVEMATPMRRYHVALVDPLPAGFEVLNPALRGTGALPDDPSEITGPWWWWSRPWYDHENLRDERVEAFAPLLWDGVWKYSYVARATTPGSFVVPPAKAEEMYMPETFGRSAGDRVVIE